MKPLEALRQRRPPMTFGHMVTFTAGAVIGSLLSVYVGPARTSWIMIGLCWLVAIALMIFEGSATGRSATPARSTPAPNRHSPAATPSQPPSASAKATGHGDASVLKKSRLRAISGGKGQPPSRAS